MRYEIISVESRDYNNKTLLPKIWDSLYTRIQGLAYLTKCGVRTYSGKVYKKKKLAFVVEIESKENFKKLKKIIEDTCVFELKKHKKPLEK